MSGFSDPVIGGGGTLVYPQIKSPNFSQAGQTGWAILKTGEAFFYELVVGPGSIGIKVTASATAPPSPNVGDLWYDTADGYLLSQWNGSAWVPYQFGTGAILPGSITAALIEAGTITATQIAAGTITASKIQAGIVLAGVVDGTTITGATIIADGSAGEYLGYDGAPAAGNLIFSVSPVSGTDAYGNEYLPGIVAYDNASYSPDGFACQMIGEGISVYESTSGGAGPWTDVTSLQWSPIQGAWVSSSSMQFTSGDGVSIAGSGWQPFGSPASGWSVGGIADYKQLADSSGVAIRIRNLNPSGTRPSDGSVVWTAVNGLPAGYRPVGGTRLVCWSQDQGSETAALEFETDGSVQVYGVGGTTTTRLDCYGTLYTV